ncbi:ubiquitin carboxyl-terminal hydrolase 4 [Grus japonensis]|uniref:Ubiquitin carboxyl-terminal hydrolase 4 n=1 Tax=Grus japonensis TaxID=30415 RepID=A0ABC9YEZ4_GRUJA
MVWSFTPEQLQDPDKVIEYLKGKCCGYSKEAQLTALCWALATVYQTLLNSRQHPQGEERENRLTGTSDTQNPATDTAATPAPTTGMAATSTSTATPAPTTDTVTTQTPVIGTAGELKNQPVLVSVAPVHKKKYTKKSVRLVKDDELGPSREQEDEVEPEVIIQSLSLRELQDMRKDFSCLPEEHIITWLL